MIGHVDSAKKKGKKQALASSSPLIGAASNVLSGGMLRIKFSPRPKWGLKKKGVGEVDQCSEHMGGGITSRR
jgi:hypothetical protein